MAVFTEVPFDTAQDFVRRLNVGELTALQGCAGGIENTNYFADTSRGRYVLTLFERLSFEQLPFYLHLMKHLAGHGIPVPDPQADDSGEILHELLGKPAALVNRLPGRHHLAPDIQHTAVVGRMMAKMHLAGLDFKLAQPNLRGLDWWKETVPVVVPFLQDEQRELIESELQFQQQVAASAAYAGLPAGPIHADLFRDNVMFDDADGRDELGGFFDFYFAGIDRFIFDIAVCLNDWCIDLDSGELVEARAQAFVAAYDEVRGLTANEIRLLPAMMRAAALRFWVSRLWDLHLPRDASMLKPHDPTHFERVLRSRIDTPWHYER
ncbi:homoserine kinase [Piscinibacter sakaiensis]|uniref:homoserine kinase n=1 Tax=Piscinibacter sakaiensis TaxID=1547922 RepID=UPI003AAD893F